MTTKSKKKTQQLIFEARYDPAYALWDNSGKIWTAISKKFSKFSAKQISPNSIDFHFDDSYEISVRLDKFHVILFNHIEKASEFLEVVSSVNDLCVMNLNIDSFTRLGLRTLLHEPSESIEEASSKLISYGIIKDRQGSYFNIDGGVKAAEFLYRIEDEDIGITVKAGTLEQKLEFEIPIQFQDEVEKLEKKIYSVNFDIDYYTKKRVSVGQLKPDEWIKQAREVIEKGLDKFLKE